MTLFSGLMVCTDAAPTNHWVTGSNAAEGTVIWGVNDDYDGEISI